MKLFFVFTSIIVFSLLFARIVINNHDFSCWPCHVFMSTVAIIMIYNIVNHIMFHRRFHHLYHAGGRIATRISLL